MDYTKLEAEILADIEWRVKELTTIKTLPLKRYLNKSEKSIVIKFAVPNIYSTWEGFVKFAFRTYINEINSLYLKYDQLHNNILSHSFDTKYPQFTTGIRNEFTSKCNFFNDFFNNLLNPIAIDSKLPTESNVNWEVVNKLLLRFNLVEFPEKDYKKMLDNLLRIRNSVAHGDNSIPIDQKMIDDNVTNVTKLMDELMFKILDGCKNTTYQRTA
jgi:hypothetical protein